VTTPFRLPCLAALALGLAAAGCSDSTAPPSGSDTGSGSFQGSVDPAGPSFVLDSIDSVIVDGVRVRVDLIGSNLVVDPATHTVSLDVAIRNAGSMALYGPAEVVIFDLKPYMVEPINPDRVENCPPRESPIIDSRGCRYGFDYSALLGDDGILRPGEISASKTWSFHLAEMTAFSFGATARFGITPDRPRIAGTVFADPNRNGQQDPDEPGFGGGTITVNGPGADGVTLMVPPDGHYVVPIGESGLYSLLAVPPPTFAPVMSTTPNPLQVLIVSGADGNPESYLHADFGFANEIFPPPPPPDSVGTVGFWDGPPDSLTMDFYGLLDISFDGRILRLRVGYSGCSPEQPFALFMVGGFKESNPVQADIVLYHDGLGQFCDAYFTKDLAYDLNPILTRYYEATGSYGPILVNFKAFNGEVHSFRLGYIR
jgi:hypothetical protein